MAVATAACPLGDHDRLALASWIMSRPKKVMQRASRVSPGSFAQPLRHQLPWSLIYPPAIGDLCPTTVVDNDLQQVVVGGWVDASNEAVKL